MCVAQERESKDRKAVMKKVLKLTYKKSQHNSFLVQFKSLLVASNC